MGNVKGPYTLLDVRDGEPHPIWEGTLMIFWTLPKAADFCWVWRVSLGNGLSFPFLFWETSGTLKSNRLGLKSSSVLGKSQ